MAMKRFLDKVTKKPGSPSKSHLQPESPPPQAAVPHSALPHHPTGLQPSYAVPPLPHPYPHEHIAVLASKDGLYLRPHLPVGLEPPTSHVRVSWGKTISIEEVEGEADVDWSTSVITYGIIGTLELFTGSYLLVITSRSDIGNLLEPSHAIFGVKGVLAIPLVEEAARITLNTLASRNATLARPSLLVARSGTLDSISDTHTTAPKDVETVSGTSTPRVTFAMEDHIKLMTPRAEGFGVIEKGGTPPSPSESTNSLASSIESLNTSAVAKAIADKLSFWPRLSKRTSVSAAPDIADETDGLVSSHDQEALETDIDEGNVDPNEAIGTILDKTAPPPTTAAEKHSQLEDKILNETIRQLGKGNMYFAYTHDLTRSLQHKHDNIAQLQKRNVLLKDLHAFDNSNESLPRENVIVLAEPNPSLPLWRRVDRRFWWNEHMVKPFIDAGIHSYVLPIMQGYCQTSTFHIPREPVDKEEGEFALVDYIILSRRSRERAGLRYQRRGIDDDAHVANFVETETIMRVEREGIINVFSHVQIRGSIPLFWTQSGYSLKPPPMLSPERTHGQNLDALKRHFEQTIQRYGPHTIVNLAEQHGKEEAITTAYRNYMSEYDSDNARYHEYDFHKETKGMKYENISQLIDKLERTFEHQGFFWVSGNTLMHEQKSVFRVNCIDCLDRTNVVQSAFARHVLNRQLGVVALLNAPEAGRTEAELVFNDVWANNGDAISRAYAGTSALKGDFTRTGRRDLTGLLNDGVNSLARMYTSTFSDWFCQAVIDFMLGNRGISVFSEFLLKLQSTDPRELIRLSKIRAEAIATSVDRVLTEGESLLSGWTLFAPTDLNTKLGEKFEEKVFLLTGHAVYMINYDYTLEKVKMYTRVPLSDITEIHHGAYILSPLEEASRDSLQNAGFTITWRKTQEQVTRMTTYSLTNSPVVPPPSSTTSPTNSRMTAALPRPSLLARRSTVLSKVLVPSPTEDTEKETAYAAFKALPIDPSRVSENGADELSGAANCKEAVDLIVDAIVRACNGNIVVKNEDIVSLTEAQRMTSVYAKMEYGVKRLLWLGG